MGSQDGQRKRQRTEDDALGGLYAFLPPPDPAKDAAAKAQVEKSLFKRPKLPTEDPTRVIFLDVDGVLLPSGSVDTIVIDGVCLPMRAVRESDFSISALGNLRSIVQQTGVMIVLSSEWRRTNELRSSINAVLKSHDIPQFRERTEVLSPKPVLQKHNGILAWCERRAREIGLWLRAHPEVTAWVALDDLDFAWADSVRVAGTPWIKYRSVHTDDKKCITETDAAEAVRLILNPPPEPRHAPKKPPQLEEVPASEFAGLLCSTEDSMPDRIRLG